MMCSDTMSDSHILDKQESGAGMGGREGGYQFDIDWPNYSR